MKYIFVCCLELFHWFSSFCLVCCSIWLLNFRFLCICVSLAVLIESDEKQLLNFCSYRSDLADWQFVGSRSNGSQCDTLDVIYIFCCSILSSMFKQWENLPVTFFVLHMILATSQSDFWWTLYLMFKFGFFVGVLLCDKRWLWSLEVLFSFIKGWFCAKVCSLITE